MSTRPPTRLLSVTSVAEQLDCSRGHVYDLIAAGKLKPADISATGTRAKTRVLASDVETYVAGLVREVASA